MSALFWNESSIRGAGHAGIVVASGVSDSDFAVSRTFAVQTGGAALGSGQTNATIRRVSLLTGEKAYDALKTIDFASQSVRGLYAELGAEQTCFDSTISRLSIGSENVSAARSRIRNGHGRRQSNGLALANLHQQLTLACGSIAPLPAGLLTSSHA